MRSRAPAFLGGILGAGVFASVALADPAIREIPDPAITPGEFASTDLADVCRFTPEGNYSQRHRPPYSPEAKRQVMAAYGIPWSERAKVEDDHILPLCAGGSDSLRNRWPQYRAGTTWTADDKDRLEVESCRDLCAPTGAANKITQPDLRARFMPDWRHGYCQRFDDPRCRDD